MTEEQMSGLKKKRCIEQGSTIKVAGRIPAVGLKLNRFEHASQCKGAIRTNPTVTSKSQECLVISFLLLPHVE